MNFVYAKYLPVAVVIACLIALFFYRWEKKYFKWVRKYWFYSRTSLSKISSLLLVSGIIMLLMALLDLRGPEEKISADIPDQKTIVLIDTSSSMLVEDVRPNRFTKSAMLARHFVKKAIGHQFSILIFSDIVQSVSPFSDDISFLDSKLQALASMDIRRGGSNIVQAINESVQYLKTETSGSNPTGNILVFTDSEDNGNMKKLNVPNGINLAIVGVGTVSGGKVPVKSKRGDFLYFKKYKGKEIISKLSETTLKEFQGTVKNYKYWVALSYSLPTNEIVSFFRTNFKKQLQQGEVRIRPVLAHLLMIPAVVCLILSYILGQFKTFTITTLLCFVLLSGGVNNTAVASEEKKATPDEIISKDPLYQKFMAAEANRSEKLKLAEKMLKAGAASRATTLYEEVMTEREDDEVIFNYGTALLKAGKVQSGLEVLNGLKGALEKKGDSKLLAKIKNNVATALYEQEKKKKEKKKEDKKKEDKEKKEKKKEDKKKDKKKEDKKKEDKKKKGDKSKDKDQKKEDQKEQQKKDQKSKGQDQKKDQKKKDQKDKKQENKGKKKKPSEKKRDQKKKQQKKKSQGAKSLKEKEEQIKKKRKLKKVPGIVKQIMDDDQKIMKRFLDTTHEKGSSDKKDW